MIKEVESVYEILFKAFANTDPKNLEEKEPIDKETFVSIYSSLKNFSKDQWRELISMDLCITNINVFSLLINCFPASLLVEIGFHKKNQEMTKLLMAQHRDQKQNNKFCTEDYYYGLVTTEER